MTPRHSSTPMDPIQEIDQQIKTLEASKDYHHQKYIQNIEILDEKLDRIEHQMERTKSHVKRDLLKRQLHWYETEIDKMDEAIETVTNKIDTEIKRLEEIKKKIRETKEKEKKSFDYNLGKLRECVQRRSTVNVFEALESIGNALEILKAERTQT